MKTKLDFESIILEDAKLDQAGIKVMESMIKALEKLIVYEVADEKRDSELAIDLDRLVVQCKLLKRQYEENQK